MAGLFIAAAPEGRSTVSDAARKYESMGYRVVGGINGDFYDTATGYPLGILISDGEILSGSSEYYAVGFYPDGSAVGAPAPLNSPSGLSSSPGMPLGNSHERSSETPPKGSGA